jgi:hypothetical protein
LLIKTIQDVAVNVTGDVYELSAIGITGVGPGGIGRPGTRPTPPPQRTPRPDRPIGGVGTTTPSTTPSPGSSPAFSTTPVPGSSPAPGNQTSGNQTGSTPAGETTTAPGAETTPPPGTTPGKYQCPCIYARVFVCMDKSFLAAASSDHIPAFFVSKFHLECLVVSGQAQLPS